MNEKTFNHEMGKAKTFHGLGDRPEYWAGFMTGLRRAFHGAAFGSEAEHLAMMNGEAHGDEARRQRLEGYREGFSLGGGKVDD
jgi:hypothetical protein